MKASLVWSQIGALVAAAGFYALILMDLPAIDIDAGAQMTPRSDALSALDGETIALVEHVLERIPTEAGE